ncbi:MAG: EndoU domain-containing protein [Ferruginibacter sp.]
MKHYYILNDVVSSNNDLPVGPRIKSQPANWIIIKYENGEGPFTSLKELRKNSSIYKKLLRENPARAQKICEKRFIFQTAELVPISDSTQKNLGNIAFEMLSHIISGKLKDKNVAGAHLFDPNIIRIEKITKEKNSKGIWEAIISRKDINQNKWVLKKLPTTFFPDFWNKGMLLIKLEQAFVKKKKISETKYIGYTECGVPIAFIYKKEKVVSAYPVYE